MTGRLVAAALEDALATRSVIAIERAATLLSAYLARQGANPLTWPRLIVAGPFDPR